MNFSRKNFLGKLGVGVLSMMGLSKYFSAQSNSSPMNPILSTKPMGFLWDTLDPFLFCAHHEDAFPQGNPDMSPAASLSGRSLGDDFIIKDGFRMYHGKKVSGFPGHPHRGFETITIVRKGIVDHSDSLGASGRYGEGDVQWMTAGKGVQHCEMFPCIHQDKANPLELFQVWLNLPAKDKMVEPHFKMLWGSSIPHIDYNDSSGKRTHIELFAGSMMNHQAPPPPPGSWAANPDHEVLVLNIMMEPGAKFVLPKAKGKVNRVIYYYEGSDCSMAGVSIPNYTAVTVDGSQDIEIVNGVTEANILVLSGRPIEEQVIAYGPFVMNTKEEIHQAFTDFNTTKFGGWPWPSYDHVHSISEKRFAKHADGTFEQGA